MVQYLLKIREEIKKLASGHISHSTALRLEKSALFSLFPKYFCFGCERAAPRPST
jgi:hypothetical protein